jgi:hypothetical protein
MLQMVRNVLVLVGLLSLLTLADASAASASVFRNPNRKIMPGNHRPIYRRYGHHGLFHNGFLGIHSHRQTKISGAKVGGSKRRGTL